MQRYDAADGASMTCTDVNNTLTQKILSCYRSYAVDDSAFIHAVLKGGEDRLLFLPDLTASSKTP